MQNQNNLDSPIINNNNLGENVKITKAPEKSLKEKKKTLYPIKKTEVKRSGNNISGRLFAAILLVAFGLIFIARNYNIISFDTFESLALFWPLVFIFIGIFLSLKENWWPVTLSLSALVLISAMTIVAVKKEDKSNKVSEVQDISEEQLWELATDGMVEEAK